MIQLEFQNVSFAYAGYQRAVLQEISFQIREGEFVLLCGASGSGKTTLLRHVVKSQIPFGNGSGKMLYRGENIETMDDIYAVREIGYVGQQPENQIVTDTVWHELAFGLESLGISTAEIRKRTAEMAEYFGISRLFRKKTAELSGGQKQLLNLASAMVLQPGLLVLDEPTSQLDPISCRHFLDVLSRLHRDFGITVLLSEQRLEQTLSLADRVMVLKQGRLLCMEEAAACAVRIHAQAPELYPALPVASRIYMESGGDGAVPLTAGEGRQYLRERMGNRVAIPASDKQMTDSAVSDKRKGAGGKPPEVSETLIELKDISFCYPGNGTEILRSLSWKLPAGSIYGILGGNGSGKTTALKIMAGIYRPSSGSCVSHGKIIYLPQNPKAVLTEISVEEELTELLLRREKKKQEIVSEVETILSMMELEGCRKQHPYDLSGGQMQRLALAKALLLKPDVLLLDEPTKGLDAALKQKFGEQLWQMKAQGVTVLLVSHDIEFCAKYLTHCGLLFDGEMIQCGETGEFFRNNYFYNTAAARIASGILQGVLTPEDILRQLPEGSKKS